MLAFTVHRIICPCKLAKNQLKLHSVHFQKQRQIRKLLCAQNEKGTYMRANL